MRKIQNQSVRKIGKMGRGASRYITLPIKLVRELRWKDNQKVVLTKHGKGILIEDWPKKK